MTVIDNIPWLLDANGQKVALQTGSGSNGTITFDLVDGSDDAPDISGWTLKLTAVDEYGGTALFTAVTGTVSDTVDGRVAFDMSAVNISAQTNKAVITIYRVNDGANQIQCRMKCNVITGQA